MRAKNKKKLNPYIAYFIAAAAVLALLCAGIFYMKSRVALVYEIELENIEAEDPGSVQAACRANNEYFQSLIADYEGCSWAWCGGNTVCIVRDSALNVDNGIDKYEGFTSVSFRDGKGNLLHGYLIDPASAPNELGRIILEDGENSSYSTVSMSVRSALRSGDVSYENAAYVWEKGSSIVYAVPADSVTPLEGKVAAFTDDGGIRRVVYILDTNVD